MQGRGGDERPDRDESKSQDDQAHPGQAPIIRLLPRALPGVARQAFPTPRWGPAASRGGGVVGVPSGRGGGGLGGAGRAGGGGGLAARPFLGGALLPPPPPFPLPPRPPPPA